MTGDSVRPGFQSIVFDCDSTLTKIEGIDELAGPAASEVRALTAAAMAGTVSLESVYGERLRHIRPSREDLDDLGRKYIATMVPDASETIAALRWLGKSVRIVSGGLRRPVEILARHMRIGVEAVAAVDVQFDDDGRYMDFDRESPLACSGGKSEVIREWNLPRRVLLVGDGATDLEARPAVDAFAAFLGVANRPEVAAGADFVIKRNSLAPVLRLAADEPDLARLRTSQWANLLDI